MKIHIDPGKCEGHAVCAGIAPSVFEVGDDDVSRVVDDDPGEAQWPAVRTAEAACPTLAITVKDESGQVDSSH